MFQVYRQKVTYLKTEVRMDSSEDEKEHEHGECKAENPALMVAATALACGAGKHKATQKCGMLPLNPDSKGQFHTLHSDVMRLKISAGVAKTVHITINCVFRNGQIEDRAM